MGEILSHAAEAMDVETFKTIEWTLTLPRMIE